MNKTRLILIIAITVSSLLAFSQVGTTIKGQITDHHYNALAGVHVYISELEAGTITNEFGEYYFSNVLSENINIQISYMGFESHQSEKRIQNGANTFDFVLQESAYHLDGIIVTAQKIEQQILNVPISMSSISGETIADLAIEDLDGFSNLVPGLNIRVQSTQRPNFVIRGLSSDEVSPNAQPRVSLFFNNTPITRASGGVLEFYDMDRIEVLKGPQGTLFGRGAQIGAVHFLSKMPTNKFEGFVSAGFGSHSQKEFSTAINIPLVENKLNARIAAIHNFREGYIHNTFGGTLNGKDTRGLRFSLRYLPTKDTKVDFVFNYQQDRAPGVGFVSGRFPNSHGDIDIFSHEASLEQGEELKTDKDVTNFSLNFKHIFNESLNLTAITSYQTNVSYERWDGDGTAAAAIDMTESIDAKLFSQELRLNYKLGNKLSGFTGFNYLREEVEQTYGFSTNEQHMVHLFLDPTNMIMPDGSPYSLTSIPYLPEVFGQLAGAPLGTSHQEENINTAKNIATEFFSDATYQLNSKISLTAGFRVVFDNSTVSHQSQFLGGDMATLGFFTQNYPNVFFRPSDLQSREQTFSGLTGRLLSMYKVNEHSNLFLSYSRGRRPNVIQYQADGSSEVMQDEVVDHFELGYKTLVNNQFLFDASIFYYNYRHFQTSAWIADPSSGNFAYLLKDAGKASSYGFETSFQYSMSEHIKLFGNYAYIHARFSDENSEGNAQAYAGNSFRLTPDHSLNLSLKYHRDIASNIQFFFIPSVSYKSHFYFEDANTEGIEQGAYTLLNLSTGFHLEKPSISFTVYSNNLLNEKYLMSAGNTGSMFGIPTYVSALPRVFGFKVHWNF